MVFLDARAKAVDDVLKCGTEGEVHVSYTAVNDSRVYMKTGAVNETPQFSLLSTH